MKLEAITPLLITFNESPNIRRVIAQLSWARDIVVIDSGSTDETLDILAKHARVRVMYRAFDSFAAQCNYGLEQIASEWVLSLDADYVLTPEFVREIKSSPESVDCAGFVASFTYCVGGHPLRSTLYPARTVLYRKQLGRYTQQGHAHKLKIVGQVAHLTSRILHDDRKPLSRWLASQAGYASMECERLCRAAWRDLSLKDRLRRMMFVTPWLVPLYCLTIGRGLLDGLPGLAYALQRGVAEAVISLKLIEHHLNADSRD